MIARNRAIPVAARPAKGRRIGRWRHAFGLVESLVAFVVLALVAAGLAQTVFATLAAATRADRREQALALAQNALATARIDGLAADGRATTGPPDMIARLSVRADDVAPRAGLRLLLAEVMVADGGGEIVRLRTMVTERVR